MDKGGDYHTDKLDNFLNSMPDSKFKSSLKSNKEKCLRESMFTLHDFIIPTCNCLKYC